jgi:hypothetical protein
VFLSSEQRGKRLVIHSGRARQKAPKSDYAARAHILPDEAEEVIVVVMIGKGVEDIVAVETGLVDVETVGGVEDSDVPVSLVEVADSVGDGVDDVSPVVGISLVGELVSSEVVVVASVVGDGVDDSVGVVSVGSSVGSVGPVDSIDDMLVVALSCRLAS